MKIKELLMIALMTACGPNISDEEILKGQLTIDQRFSDDQIEMIIDAVDVWTEATDGCFKPQIVIDQVECNQPFSILAVEGEDCGVGQRIDVDGKQRRVLGLSKQGVPTVILGTFIEGERFFNNAVHELGHHLHLEHDDGGFMAQDFKHEQKVVTQRSVDRLAERWSCD